MKITRNGQEFELTERELHKAWQEYNLSEASNIIKARLENICLDKDIDIGEIPDELVSIATQKLLDAIYEDIDNGLYANAVWATDDILKQYKESEEQQ